MDSIGADYTFRAPGATHAFTNQATEKVRSLIFLSLIMLLQIALWKDMNEFWKDF
jgi:hypothetical protein